MKQYSCSLLLLATFAASAQTKASWGSEFKMSKESTGLAMVAADKTGEYLQENHETKSVGMWSATFRTSAELVKLNSSLTEVYRSNFDKELHGKSFENFLYLNDRLFIFSSEVEKHDGVTKLYVAEVDKNTGHLMAEWKQVHQWQKAEKKETLRFKASPNEDSTRVILTATYEGRENNRYELQALDASTMVPQGNSVTVSNEFDPKTFQVEDFVYTSSGNAVVVGRLYAYEEGKKKKDKNLDFKNYSIRIYKGDGTMIKDIVTDTQDKFMITSKVVAFKNDLVLAAFYSNTKKKKDINGMIVERINPSTGEVITSVNKELNASSVTEIDDDPADKSALKKDGADEDGLSANLRFNKFYLTPDNGILILAEYFNAYLTSSTQTVGTATYSSSHMNYDCRDIYMAKVNAGGSIDWLHVLPKSQYETISVGGGVGPASGFSYTSYYFDDNWSRPFFAGFGSIESNGKVHLFFNDYTDNADILEPGKHIHRVNLYDKTSCYEIVLDMVTGKYTRREVFSNRGIPNAMPRLGVAMGNTLYLTGQETHFFGKARVAVGRLTLD